MAIRVAINGFGRTGRMALRAAHEAKCEDVEVMAINDLGPVATKPIFSNTTACTVVFPARSPPVIIGWTLAAARSR
jgi:glyceraldehyde-3-phosphate dehydrogenase/erythrose-4-phosphate dehydrogenase